MYIKYCILEIIAGVRLIQSLGFNSAVSDVFNLILYIVFWVNIYIIKLLFIIKHLTAFFLPQGLSFLLLGRQKDVFHQTSHVGTLDFYKTFYVNLLIK